MKLATARGPIHAKNCACPRCRHIRAVRRTKLDAGWAEVILALLLLATCLPFAAWCDSIRL